MRILIIWLAPSLLLMGCASAYKPTHETNAAKIRYVNASETEDVDVFTFDNDQCNDAQLIGALRKRKYPQEDGVSRQGIPLAEGLNLDRIKETAIQPGKSFVSYVRRSTISTPMGGLYIQSCKTTFSITPEKNGLYEAVYREGNGQCYIDFFVIERASAGEYTRRQASNLINTSMKQCSY